MGGGALPSPYSNPGGGNWTADIHPLEDQLMSCGTAPLMLTIHEALVCDDNLDTDGRARAFAEARELIRSMHGLGDDMLARASTGPSAQSRRRATR